MFSFSLYKAWQWVRVKDHQSRRLVAGPWVEFVNICVGLSVKSQSIHGFCLSLGVHSLGPLNQMSPDSFQFYDWKIPFLFGDHDFTINLPRWLIQVGTHFIHYSFITSDSKHTETCSFWTSFLVPSVCKLTLRLLWQRVNQHSLTHSLTHGCTIHGMPLVTRLWMNQPQLS